MSEATMRTLLALALLAATSALAPVADAEQACIHGRGSHCEHHLLCYYNRLTGE